MRKRLHDEQANSVVELALILPFLLLLILGTIELGQGFRTYMALGNAAREGARWLTTHPADPAGARTLVASEAARVGLSAGDITTTITPVKSQYQAGDTVTVQVTCLYPLLFGDLTGFATLSFNLQTSMRVLYD